MFEVFLTASDMEAMARREPLPPRERDTIALVAHGKTDEEISCALTMSPATVRHHLDNVRTKLGAASRAEAVALLAVSGEI